MEFGGTRSDYEVQGLAGPLQIDGVVNLASSDVAELVTTASLWLACLHLEIALGAARGGANYVHWPISCIGTRREFNVYMRDDIGGGPAIGGPVEVARAIDHLLSPSEWLLGADVWS